MTLIYAPHPQNRPEPVQTAAPGTPFTTAEEAWFWCVRATEARHAGARPRAGMATTPRPCDAVDIQNAVLRLARGGRLNESHLVTLGRYGRLQLRPGTKTAHDLMLWQQAIDRLGATLRAKGIIKGIITWAAQMLAVAFVILDNPERAPVLLNAIGQLDTIWTVGLSVLGIYVYKRSGEKARR